MYESVAPFMGRTQKGARQVMPGEIVEMPEDWGKKLMREGKVRPLPYFDRNGDLVIPFNSDPKYHCWADGWDTKQWQQ